MVLCNSFAPKFFFVYLMHPFAFLLGKAWIPARTHICFALKGNVKAFACAPPPFTFGDSDFARGNLCCARHCSDVACKHNLFLLSIVRKSRDRGRYSTKISLFSSRRFFFWFVFIFAQKLQWSSDFWVFKIWAWLTLLSPTEGFRNASACVCKSISARRPPHFTLSWPLWPPRSPTHATQGHPGVQPHPQQPERALEACLGPGAAVPGVLHPPDWSQTHRVSK